MPLRAINELKSSSETDIQVIGGGKFITSLIEASLLDEITLYIVPVMLGDGIKFIGKTFGSKWELTGHRVTDNQVVRLTYSIKENDLKKHPVSLRVLQPQKFQL